MSSWDKFVPLAVCKTLQICVGNIPRYETLGIYKLFFFFKKNCYWLNIAAWWNFWILILFKCSMLYRFIDDGILSFFNSIFIATGIIEMDWMKLLSKAILWWIVLCCYFYTCYYFTANFCVTFRLWLSCGYCRLVEFISRSYWLFYNQFYCSSYNYLVSVFYCSRGFQNIRYNA